MAADVSSSLASWSTTESSNSPSGSTAISTNLDDNLRMIQAVVRTMASAGTIASASTTDLSTVSSAFVSVSGTTTITSFGTLSAGMYKFLRFTGAGLTITYNATSMITPTGASLAVNTGDVVLAISEGSGNWRILGWWQALNQTLAGTLAVGGAATFSGASSNSVASAGTLNIRGGQIGYPATQVASTDPNTLDDYEEGTWTPALTFGGGSAGLTYTTQTGSYVKVGKLVTYTMNMVLSSKGSSTGTVSISGLPAFTADSNSHSLSIRLTSMTSGVGDTHIQGIVSSGTNSIAIGKIATGSNTSLTDADFTATSSLIITGSYIATA